MPSKLLFLVLHVSSLRVCLFVRNIVGEWLNCHHKTLTIDRQWFCDHANKI